MLLILYSLFKQATEGDVQGEKPSRINFKERAKFEAWDSKKGLSSTQAMTKYVEHVNKLFSEQ